MNEQEENGNYDELMKRAAALPKGVQPARDLWPDIERSITAHEVPRRSAFGSAWAQAAAVVLLIGASSGITYVAMRDGGQSATPQVVPGKLNLEWTAGSFGEQHTLGEDYLNARSNLANTLEERLRALPPETRDDVRANLETIRRAISNLSGALADEPDNVLLQELLLDTYQDELAVMKRVDDLTRTAMRRGDI